MIEARSHRTTDQGGNLHPLFAQLLEPFMPKKLSPAHRDVFGENSNFMAFCAKYGDDAGVDVMEKIADAMWERQPRHGVTFRDIHQHNACNHTASGDIEYQGETFGFVIESGDRSGTVILEWGPSEDVGTYQPEPPTIYTFVPQEDNLKETRPGLWAVYLAWTKQPWFQEKERGYNYDRHFAPGGKTESYYRDWAATKGMKIAAKGNSDG